VVDQRGKRCRAPWRGARRHKNFVTTNEQREPSRLKARFCHAIQDTTASGGISGRLSITLSTKPKSLAISAVIK
jgi:hypothetical protein